MKLFFYFDLQMPYSSPAYYDPPEKDSEDLNTTSGTSSEAVPTSTTDNVRKEIDTSKPQF